MLRGFSVFLLAIWLLMLGLAISSWPNSSPSPVPDLIAANLANSGVTHPVTAVLLNYRAYDTLLEIAVLLLALVGVWAAFYCAPCAKVPHPFPTLSPLLAPLLPLSIPLLVLTAGYLLWAGAHTSGGAFQAGALLGGAGVLLRLSGSVQVRQYTSWPVRMLSGIGLLVFAGVGVAVMLVQPTLLTYPPGLAKTLILLIEGTLTVSIGMTLALLFVATPGIVFVREPHV